MRTIAIQADTLLAKTLKALTQRRQSTVADLIQEVFEFYSQVQPDIGIDHRHFQLFRP